MAKLWIVELMITAIVMLSALSSAELENAYNITVNDPVQTEALEPSSACVEPLGIPLAPPVYLINFLLLYFTNPEIAAYMPAYRAALPQEVYECLVENPDGCPYTDMAQYFDEQALESGGSRNKNTSWPSSCQTDPKWQSLAPPEYQQADQINQPLGKEKADRLARLLGIDQDMILTDEEYECMIGTPPRGPAREIIFVCTNDLTNSNGNAVIPFRVTDYLSMHKGMFEAIARLKHPVFFSTSWPKVP